MTEQQQRIAIAEFCPFVKPYGKGELLWKAADGRNIYFDPLNDLNAMHAAEKLLTNDQWSIYSPKLWLITHQPPATYECHASAAQRAEALLRTIRKWEDA